MKKIVVLLGLCTAMACGVASAADGQVVSKAQATCQDNSTQCAQMKSAAKANAGKEVQAAKNSCAKNQAACDHAKNKVKSATTAK